MPGQNELKVGANLAGLRIVPVSKLPTNLSRGPVDEYCTAYVVTSPKSPGGRFAARNGWIVTSETKLGDYDAINFVGALEPATSATCFHKDGNLAVFDGPRLKAIAYLNDPSESALGSAEQIDQRRIRLNTGMPGAPYADVVLRDGIYIEQTAKEDKVCGGAAVVPNIYNEDIRQARKRLRVYGWQPQKSSEEINGGLDEDLKAEGVVEVEACAGTGYGFCKFNYVHSKGFGLEVISAGDDPNVIGFEAYCSPQKD